MTYPNAYEGVKKIFTAQILEIISTVAVAVAGVAGVVFLAAVGAESAGTAIGTGIGTIVFGIGAAVLGIIALILTLTGLKKAGNDEVNFTQGFVAALIVLILKVAYGFLSSFAGATIFDDLVIGIAGILEVAVTMYVVRGITALAEQLGKESMANKGRTLFMAYAIILVVSNLLRFIGALVGNNSVAVTVTSIIAIIAGIGSVVAYIIYLIYLAQAKKMLSEN